MSYTHRAENCLVFRRLGSISDTPLAVIFPVVRRLGSFSYTPRAGEYVLSFFGTGVSLNAHAAICLVVKRIKRFVCVRSADSRSLLTPPATICLVVRHVGRLSYTHRAENCLIFRRGGSLSDTSLAVIVPVVRRLGSFYYTPRAGESVLSFFGTGVSLTRPVIKSV